MRPDCVPNPSWHSKENKGAPGLDYKAFKKRVQNEKFSKDQEGPLNLRLQPLESFLEPSSPGPAGKKATKAKRDVW